MLATFASTIAVGGIKQYHKPHDQHANENPPDIAHKPGIIDVFKYLAIQIT